MLKTVALVGTPNSGKTTLFNALTGLSQKVANYAGVTVAPKEGLCHLGHHQKVQLIDLPGAYSLSAYSEDELVLKKTLIPLSPNTSEKAKQLSLKKMDAVIYVIDANQLTRGLYLLTQTIPLNYNSILVLNRMDTFKKSGMTIDLKKLQSLLGIPVVACQAHKKIGIPRILVLLRKNAFSQSSWKANYPETWNKLFQHFFKGNPCSAEKQQWILSSLLNGKEAYCEALRQQLSAISKNWQLELIKARYDATEELVSAVTEISCPASKSKSERFDTLALHPFWGWGILISLCSVFFVSLFSVAEIPAQWIQCGISFSLNFIQTHSIPSLLQNLLVGMTQALGNILKFLPQLIFVYAFIHLVEATGYLTRMTFLLERILNVFGLPGKAFLPIFTCSACTVPGILASRCLSSPTHRKLSLFIMPWVPCSAQIPIYIFLLNLLCPPQTPAWIKGSFLAGIYIFVLFISGIFTYGLHQLQSRKNKITSPSFLELPRYRLPTLKNFFLDIYFKITNFVKTISGPLFIISLMVWILTHFPNNPKYTPGENLSHSYIGQAAQKLNFLWQPLGYNWKIGTAVLTAFMARETFISTLSILYPPTSSSSLQDKEAPSCASLNPQQSHFPFSKATIGSLIVFFSFSLQCITTCLALKKESFSWKVPLGLFVFMFLFAYTAAALSFYLFSYKGLVA